MLAALLDGRVEDYRFESNVLADWYDDAGDACRAARRRQRALTYRSPGCLWPKPRHLAGLSDHQREHLRCALTGPLALLTGTPGTGKTYCVAAIVHALASRPLWAAIALAAPTGKAATRMTESLVRHGVPLAARTIHSLLEIGRDGHDGEGWGFRRNARLPLDVSFVIVDEASMLDTDLAAALLSACRPGTHVLLVGDPNQLPPVGHGAPLRDMIAAGVPCAALSEIRRNAGMIVEACAAIRQGKEFAAHPLCELADTRPNLLHADAASPARQIEQLLKVVGHIAKSEDRPGQDSQVIVATNTKGPLARRTINRLLQQRLNPAGATAGGNPFRIGDKVICLKNGWYSSATGGEDMYVANGEIGRCAHVEPRSAAVVFRNPLRYVCIPCWRPAPEDSDADQGEDQPPAGKGEDQPPAGTGNFDLGWAITCHKSQGSEWPVVVVLVDDSPGARRICTREWLYTAVSRARGQCILIGNLGAAQQMVRRVSRERRRTFLKELLTERQGGLTNEGCARSDQGR